jgi:hypothetical protein
MIQARSPAAACASVQKIPKLIIQIYLRSVHEVD